MTARPTISATDMTLTAIVGVLMIIAVPFLFNTIDIASTPGLTFNFSGLKVAEPLIQQATTAAVLLLCAVATVLLNRHFNFIKGTDNSFAAFLFIFCASDPLTVSGFSYPVLLLVLELACLYLLFGCYKSLDATQPVYLAATATMSVAMFTAAALVMIPVLIIGMFIMNIVRPREIFAFGMGLFTPWWILTGFGIINPLDLDFSQFSFPTFDYNFSPLMIGVAVSIIFTFIFSGLLSLDNSFSKMSGNIRTRALNKTVNTAGIMALIFMLTDSDHLQDYSAMLYLTAALQTGNFFSINNFRSGRRIELGILALYTVFYGVTIYLNTL